MQAYSSDLELEGVSKDPDIPPNIEITDFIKEWSC